MFFDWFIYVVIVYYHTIVILSIQKIRYFQKNFYRTNVRLYSALIVQFLKYKQMFYFGKMGKNRAFYIGGTKNQNKCSVFRAAYKLLHPHTNLKIKHLNKNPIKSSKIKHFAHFNPKNPNIAPNIVKPN